MNYLLAIDERIHGLGVSCLAGLAEGLHPYPAHLAKRWMEEHRFMPRLPVGSRQEHRELWHRAVQRSQKWIAS